MAKNFQKWPNFGKIPNFQNSKIKNFGKILEKLIIKDTKPIKKNKKLINNNLRI